jgi:NitT/TauT family transport system ATP-binding protein
VPLTVENVVKDFDGGVRALDDVSLSIKDGEFVSLIGPSGCGKSTLLAILAGLDRPTRGGVSGGGKVGMVFQEAALFPWRTVRDNVAFGLQMRGVSKTDRHARADDALRLVHLSRFADAFPHQLSGGMRQRAAIARALVTDPDVLLMDEPFGALDAQTRALLQVELLTVHQATGKTVVFVTHGLDEALELSDRIVLMSARPGRILADLRVDAARPRDPQADPALRALREHLMGLLSREVESVARAEHDAGWGGLADAPTTLRPPVRAAARDDIGAEI